MAKAVLKATGYSLIHAPHFLEHLGTTQTSSKKDSEYMLHLKEHLRSYEEVLNYLPHQVYIGNLHPDDLKDYEKPFFKAAYSEGKRYGAFGEIMPEDEFILLIKCADAFDLVLLEETFVNNTIKKYEKHALKTEKEIALLNKSKVALEEVENALEKGAYGMYFDAKLVGCVKKAHDVDPNLTSHVMLENLISKASSAVAIKHLLAQHKINPEDIGYVIECSEEACGDMNQRGGGNFAKAIAEMTGLQNAGGCDIRAFCAAPVHSLVHAAAMVESNLYDNVLVVAGGASAKLGMNGKDHVKKGSKILEDVLGTFAVLVSKNDGTSPVIRTDIVGVHKVKTGSSPQVVTKALVEEPLERNNLSIKDIDKYSVEMQNPDITSLAGAGDVPLANYKMIAALAVMRKEIERSEIMNFVDQHGMIGWAPTQGHIPSGVPYCGHLQNDLTKETGLNRGMIIGKGSLFLARMTNQFDGISVVIERNLGEVESQTISKEEIRQHIAKAMKDFASSLLDK